MKKYQNMKLLIIDFGAYRIFTENYTNIIA